MPEEEEDEDTDTKLAILASLLEPATYPFEDLLEALNESAGDVAKAAEAILLPRVKGAGKRKAGTSLESWLGKKRETRPGSDVIKNTPSTPPSRPLTNQMKEVKPVNLLDHLKQPTAEKKSIPRPAVHLPHQAAINSHGLPLSILQSPLSPQFASALYLAMMEESETWERNKFYLAGKWVESPHTVCHYARDPTSQSAADNVEAKEKQTEIELLEGKAGRKATYMWSGQEIAASRLYPALLRQAAEMIEPVVDAAIRSRPRYPYEWAGDWKASVCGANRYEGASSNVGWHADQLTYLGPYTTIASLSLGTPRAFRIRQTDPVDLALKASAPTRTYEVTLGHNSLVLMNAGCQERFKHTVPIAKALDLFRPGYDSEQRPIPVDSQKSYTSRINITFRFYRPDFHPSPGTGPGGPRQGTPYCKCGIPTLLRADQKAKARSFMSTTSPSKNRVKQESKKKLYGGQDIVDDDMIFFWQCQAPGQTGDMKGCGFFRILDMRSEGRGPCLIDCVD